MYIHVYILYISIYIYVYIYIYIYIITHISHQAQKPFNSYLTDKSQSVFETRVADAFPARTAKRKANLEEEGLHDCLICNQRMSSSSMLDRHLGSEKHRKHATKLALSGDPRTWRWMPSVLANVASFEKPNPQATPYLQKLSSTSPNSRK